MRRGGYRPRGRPVRRTTPVCLRMRIARVRPDARAGSSPGPPFQREDAPGTQSSICKPGRPLHWGGSGHDKEYVR